MPGSCAAFGSVHSPWNFCPNIAASYLFCALFAATTTLHLAQAIIFKKTYCGVIVASGLVQTICYIFRILSITNPTNSLFYDLWFVLILVAPLFTNAFVYMTMGRMVWNFADEKKIFGVTATRFGLYFVLLDILAFIVQVAGAATAVGGKPAPQVLNSLHIYMGGVGMQEIFILIFLVFAVKLHLTINFQARRDVHIKPKKAILLLYTLYTVLFLISLRIGFRLVEYSGGLKSSIPNHEAFQYSLDSLPMLIALMLLNVVHPGQVMRGQESDIPGRKERKLEAEEEEKQAALRYWCFKAGGNV